MFYENKIKHLQTELKNIPTKMTWTSVSLTNLILKLLGTCLLKNIQNKLV